MSFSNDLEDAADAYKAPTLEASRYAREELWSEVLPGLFQGGTHDDDVVWNGERMRGITIEDFDFVTTLYADANPVGWFVQEIRYGIYDSNMNDFDMEELLGVVHMTHRAWKNGKRTLVRCQAGWNRSGLVMALILIKEGMTASDAIALLRQNRSPYAICNKTFEDWLINYGAEAVKN